MKQSEDIHCTFVSCASCSVEEQRGLVTPVNLKRVLSVTPSFCGKRFKLGNQILSHVWVVGVIRSIDCKAVTYEYIFEDETGNVTVRYNGSTIGSPNENLKINTFVSVHGQIIEMFGTKVILTLTINPVLDHNVIAFHGLQVLLPHLVCIKSKKRHMSEIDVVGREQLQNQDINQDHSPNKGRQTYEKTLGIKHIQIQVMLGSKKQKPTTSVISSTAATTTSSTILKYSPPDTNISFTGQKTKSDSTNIYKKIYSFISKVNVFEGVNFAEIQRDLGSDFNPSTIKHTIDVLVESGILYPVLDELHFQTAYN